MKTRRLGNTDLALSEIGFGAWAVGGGGWQFGWGPQDDDESIGAIRRGMDLGVNWIDTAPVYGLGHSEQLVGRAIEGRREQVIVATKCSLVWDDRGTILSSLARESVRRECEASLRRLRTDRIDLYQIHWPNDDRHIEEGWEEIGRLIDEGKVRHAGVSNFQVRHLDRVLKTGPIASLQPPYSMVQRDVEKEILGHCAKNQIGVVAYSPMASGLLTGRFDRSKLAPDDWRAGAEDFNEPRLGANLRLVEGLRPIAARRSRTVSQLAIAWVLRRPEVTSAIVGARRASQIEETVGGADFSLDTDDLAEIERLVQERDAAVEPNPVRFRR
jgi:aryl-alcohol dehydrogenase-like predicted oxidoreductase